MSRDEDLINRAKLFLDGGGMPYPTAKAYHVACARFAKTVSTDIIDDVSRVHKELFEWSEKLRPLIDNPWGSQSWAAHRDIIDRLGLILINAK
jgi:hypothetical protein